MGRLTQKNGDSYIFERLSDDGQLNVRLEDEPIDKLGKLEDIEDELGLDLITLFKALCGTYAVKEDDGHVTEEWSCPRFQAPAILGHGFNAWIVIRDDEHRKILYLKDYGKTWALTKEELQ